MDDATRRDIDKVVWQLLRDAGETEPPVRTEVLLEFGADAFFNQHD